jgi:hypothetical protein
VLCVFTGCLGRLFKVAVVVAVIAAMFHYRGDLGAAWRDLRQVRVVRTDSPAPPLAESSESKIAALAQAREPMRVTLTEAELQSLVEYRLLGFLPEPMASPRVQVRNGQVRVQVRVPTEILAGLPDVPDLLGWLPDSTVLAATGQLIPLDGKRVALAFQDVNASRVPLPRSVIPGLLERLGRPDEAGLTEDAWAIPLPPGATDIYVRGDTLVVLARPAPTGSE